MIVSVAAALYFPCTWSSTRSLFTSVREGRGGGSEREGYMQLT